jgi:dGTPase
MIHFDDAHAVGQDELKRFLRKHLYMHPRVGEMTEQAHETIRLLFAVFMADHSAMPQRHAERATRAAKRGEAAAARVVADYIAGMTDRFALGLCEQFRH